jgi:type I restriction enzyme S subunit
MAVATRQQIKRAGYKQTAVGVMPEDWDVKNLGDIGECLIGLTYEPSNVKADGLLVLRSSNIADGGLRFDDNVFVDIAVPERIILRKDDLLICVRNGSRALIGKCALIDQRAEGMTFGAFMAVFRTKHARFVFHAFESDLVKKQIHQHIGATINQITNKNLKSFEIPFPRREEEQGAISEALSDVDALITSLDDLIAKKRDVRIATMQQLLTGKRQLSGFRGGWDVQRLSAIGSFSKGSGIRKDEVVPNGLPCVRYGEIYTRHNDYIRRFYSFIPPEVAKGSHRLRKGDLLFTGSGETAEDIGKCVAFLGDEEAYAGGDIIILSPVGQNSMYLGYLLNHASITDQRARLGQGEVVVHISATSLGRLQLKLPSLEEQTAIASMLSDMDVEIAELEARRDKARALKQGMMQQLLTGSIRLV